MGGAYMEWEYNFSKRVLNRGFNYYLDGYVENIYVKMGKWSVSIWER